MTLIELYRKYNRFVYWLVKRHKLIARIDEQADARQVIWEQIVKSYPKYDKKKASLATWITAIANFHCLRYLRDSARTSDSQPNIILESEIPVETDETGKEIPWLETQSGYPDDSPENAEIRDQQWLLKLATLSQKENAIFNLIYWHGYAPTKVSEWLGVALGTVYVVMANIRNKLLPKKMFYGDKVYLNKDGGNPWNDWSWKPGAAKESVERTEELRYYYENSIPVPTILQYKYS